jgi:hypothetical protein
MARKYDRPATVTALVNAGVVYLIPIAFVGLISLLPDRHAGTTVYAHGPDYLMNRAKVIVAYVTAVAPFAMAAAWRTFVHARRWLECHDRTWWGVLEAGGCGLAGTLLVLLPGIVTRPLEAPPYIIVYGLPTIAIGLVIGVILRLTALGVLKLWTAGTT